MKDDTISRRAAIDALNKMKIYRPLDPDRYVISDCLDKIINLPSAQPGQRNARVFQGIIVEYPSISAYPEYEGKPYFSIKYTENGQEFIGYGTYKLEVLSEYLKEYFMPPTQPECEDAVSREAVLNEIHRYMEERDYTIGLLDDNVCGLPPVTPKQPGWIPVTVRLPDNDRPVLVTLKWSEDDYEVTTGEYWRDSTVCHGWGNFGDVVIAWQPLPTPYREGGQDD